jgi:hypothetical protein
MNNVVDRQIFIGGCERSGTTLLGAMLGAHSACICTPESHFKIRMLRSHRNRGELDPLTILRTLETNWRFKLWGLDLDFNSISESELSNSYQGLLAWLVKRYAEKHGKATASIWIDHTPENTKYAATLSELFPQAKMIHIVRDGRAVAASVMPLDWGPNTIIETAPWWMKRVAYGLAAESTLEKNRIMRVKYEDLVQNPEMILKRLCTYLDIDYQPEMIKANGFRAPRYSLSQHTLIGKPPDATRATAWKKELIARQIEVFESLTYEFLVELGYSLRYGLKARKPTRRERIISQVREFLRRKVINRIRYRVRFRMIS